MNITEDIIRNKHHVLEVAYNSLSPDEQKLLSIIACLRSATGYKTLLAIFVEQSDSPITQSLLDNQLNQLETRSLLHWDKATNKYDLHPIVRRYAYERLTAPDRTAAHTRLRDYFEAVPKPEKIESLNDLAPVIELYHHMVRAGQFDEARQLYQDRINDLIYYEFGAYELQIELLQALFPDGEEKPPKLKSESAQAQIINDLANVYAFNGEPLRGISLHIRNLEYDKKNNRKKHLTVGLGNIAQKQLSIGKIKEAERNLYWRIDLSRELGDGLSEAIAHHYLGRVFMYLGVWEKSEQELLESLRLFQKEHAIQLQGITWAFRSLRALLMTRDIDNLNTENDHFQKSVDFAKIALYLMFEWQETAERSSPNLRDYVRTLWILGKSCRENILLEEAEKHLNKSLSQCRTANMVNYEAYILLEVSKLRHAQGNPKEALRLAQEALIITERSGYVLQGSDVNLWLADLALEGLRLQVEGDELSDRELAKEYAEKALQLAHCDDGPPYHYKVAYDEALALLEKLKE